MPTHIERLTALQRIDQGIREKKRGVEESARQLRTQEDAVQQREAEIGELRGRLAEAKDRQVTLERDLAEIEDKMKDRRMRLQRIRNEKELQATQREIDVMKERTSQLEEEELQVLEEVEVLTAKTVAGEENLRGSQQALAEERAALALRESALSEEVDRESQRRRELATSLDAGLFRRYELIFTRRQGTAVVAVRGGICQGCHMNVPPQLYNQILKGEDVFDCPSCHRLLFAEQETSDVDLS